MLQSPPRSPSATDACMVLELITVHKRNVNHLGLRWREVGNRIGVEMKTGMEIGGKWSGVEWSGVEGRGGGGGGRGGGGGGGARGKGHFAMF